MVCKVCGASASTPFAKEWRDRIRTPEDPICNGCAGVHSTTDHTKSVSAHACCAECGKSGAEMREVTQAPVSRTRSFCGEGCQSTFYARDAHTVGMPLSGAGWATIGVLVHGPGDSIRLDPGDKEEANQFFNPDAAWLMRTYERAKALEINRDYGLYPTYQDVMTAIEDVERVSVERKRRHYVIPDGGGNQAGASGGYTKLISPGLGFERPDTLLGGVPNTLFLKAARIQRPPDRDILVMFQTVIDLILVVSDTPQNDPNVDEPRAQRRHIRSATVLVRKLFDELDADSVLGQDIAGIAFMRLAILMARRWPDREEVIIRTFEGLWDSMGWHVKSLDDLENIHESNFHYHSAYLPSFARTFSYDPNWENVNDVVVGARLSALSFSAIAPIFTPVYDNFVANTEHGTGEVSAKPTLFTISYINHASILGLVLEARADADFSRGIDFVRSVFLQVLLGLEAAQHHLQVTHYDLHPGNVMAYALPATHANAFLQWRRPNGDDMFVPTSHTANHLVRFIDYGRTRCGHPDDPTNPERAAYHYIDTISSAKFDTSNDMRVFAYNFFWQIRNLQWVLSLEDKIQRGNTDAINFMEVLELMVGMRDWTAINPLLYRFSIGSFRQFHNDLKRQPPMGEFRVNEIFGNRPEEGLKTPTQVLDSADFFTPYIRKPSDDKLVEFIGDATGTIRTSRTR